mmetsp:Transcript_24042/g.56971  ORF Transcript_24042/g.56971 Transcript_24042/m.56971 type:complete len:273 (+) Transcript_24042:320-1138(+)
MWAAPADSADLLAGQRPLREAVEAAPRSQGHLAIHEVDKGVTQVRPAVEITRQVRKVVAPTEAIVVQHGQKHLPRVVVGNIPEHNRCLLDVVRCLWTAGTAVAPQRGLQADGSGPASLGTREPLRRRLPRSLTLYTLLLHRGYLQRWRGDGLAGLLVAKAPWLVSRFLVVRQPAKLRVGLAFPKGSEALGQARALLHIQEGALDHHLAVYGGRAKIFGVAVPHRGTGGIVYIRAGRGKLDLVRDVANLVHGARAKKRGAGAFSRLLNRPKEA